MNRRRIARSDDRERDNSQKVDLRTLDYVSEYDPNLMCPICHVPFVEPVVLDCDHTFCSSCFDEYRDSGTSGVRPQCPACRTYLLAGPRKASRLIVNMCNDLRVHCPNEGCLTVIPRGCVEQHVGKDCPEERLACPDAKCGQTVKRKNFVPEQCIHSSHIECDCGAVIELGRGEWLRHRDEECPSTAVKCERCGERILAKDYLAGSASHVCPHGEAAPRCPGFQYGCHDEVSDDDLETHTQSCLLARLAPHLTKQSELLQSLQEQLTMTKIRNEVLETGLDKINDILHDRILPSMGRTDHSPPGEASDIEEIERDHIPSALSERDLVLPAHLRALTPSPDANSTSLLTQQHLLALHESLRGNVSTLENDISALSNTISELDARASMQLMNETLRIKEELAHTNAALFSTRAQVQWLLNRERAGQQQQMGMRGRAPSAGQGHGASSSTQHSASGEAAEASLGITGETQASGLSASPNFRPQMRRLSGSQERVKL